MAGVVAGPRELVEKVARAQVDTGATLGPFEAFLVLRGLLTLAVRMDRHAANALALATLARASGRRAPRPLPGPPEPSPARRGRCASSAPGNGGGMLAFEVAGGRAGGRAVIDTLRLTELTASLGSVHTMVVHPPSTSQRQLSEAELIESGHHARACSG